MFLRFANFYCQFIQGFSRITIPLTSILKTSGSIESTTRPGKIVVGVSDDSRARCNRNKLDKSEFDGSEIDNNEVDGGKIDNEIGKKDQKMSKSKNFSKSKKILGSDFLTPAAGLAFTKLRQIFVKALILYHFDSERHIRVETDASGYAICGILNQLTLNNLNQWHPVVFFS